MNEVSFWQPIYHPNPTGCLDRTSDFFDDFFFTGGERAYVSEIGQLNGRQVEYVQIRADESSYTCLKQFLKYTVVVAIFMVIGKFFCRCFHNYLNGPAPEVRQEGQQPVIQQRLVHTDLNGPAPEALQEEQRLIQQGLMNTHYEANDEQRKRMYLASFNVKESLHEIFSAYLPQEQYTLGCHCYLPVYPDDQLNERGLPERDKMAFPVMQGFSKNPKNNEDIRPYIVIKVTSTVTDEDIQRLQLRDYHYKPNRKLEEIILLYQYYPNDYMHPFYHYLPGENVWNECSATVPSPHFFTSNLTNGNDGKLTNSQRENGNMERFKNLLATGTGTDIHGLVWHLDYTGVTPPEEA